MNWLRTIWLRIRALFRKQQLDAAMEEEMRAHIEMQAQENIQTGMSSEEARQAAGRQFGWVESIKETCREQRGLYGAEMLARDVRFALRMLHKNPGFTTVSLLTLALGIGANTAIFSIINAVLLRPLPYRDPDRLVTVCEQNLNRGYSHFTVTPANLQSWREQNTVFAELGGEIFASFNLTGLEKPQHLNAAATTPNFFSIFGVAPLLGRTFAAGDQTNGEHRVAVLSYKFWRTSFAGDRQIVGRKLTLNGVTYTVVGVMPQSFKIFALHTSGLPTGEVEPQLWVPYEGSMNETDYHFFGCFGRLKPGVSFAQAQSEMNAITERNNQGFPRRSGWGAIVQPLREEIIGDSRPACLLLTGAAAFLLLIACANVANLSLARSAARGREFAMRTALGAGRSRLICQLVVESLILAIIGGALGILLARWSLAGLLAFLPARFPRLDEVSLDGRVLGFSLLVSLLTGVAFGLAPAWHVSRRELTGWLKHAAFGYADGPHQRCARDSLVLAEIASVTILLVGAVLLLSSFARLIRVNPGFEPARLISFDVSPPDNPYADDAKRLRLVKQLRTQVGALPGVDSAAIVYGLPFGTMLNATCGARVEGWPDSQPHPKGAIAWRVVSPGYFGMMRVPVLAGRSFSEDLDRSDSPPVSIINEAFARKYFRNQNPVGRRIQIFTVSTNWTQVVAVVKDQKLTGLDAPAVPEIYQPDSQQAPWMFSLVVRSSFPLSQISKMVQDQAAQIDKDLPLFNARTMDQSISSSVSPHRLTMLLTGIFAALALTLTAVGIYGVVSYSVGQRTREIGIRIALGASSGSVLALVLRQGFWLAILGIAIGLVTGLALTRLIANQLFGVSPADPPTFGFVSIFVMLVMLAASYLPARRATKVDPMVSLRYE
jgi:putative ABC transport system permease protein